MEDVSMITRYTGMLTVRIKGFSSELAVEARNDELYIIASKAWVALTAKVIAPFPEQWKLISYSPEQGILEVEKVA